MTVVLLGALIFLALSGWKSVSTGWLINIKSQAAGSGWTYRIMDIDHNLTYHMPLERDVRHMESISPNGRYGVFSDDGSAVLVDLRNDVELATISGTVRSWSPDSHYFSYTDTDVNSHTYTKTFIVEINENGVLSEPTPMTLDNSDPLPGYVVWSPDSEQLAFLVNDGGSTTELLIANADGSDARSLLPTVSLIQNMSWSRDAEQIAFYWYDPVGRIFHLGHVNVDGTEQEIIAVDVEALVSAVSWSPDERYMAYLSAPGRGLYIIDAETADITGPIAYQVGFDAKDMLWSPDGERLVYHFGQALYVIGRDGRNLRQLTHSDEFYFFVP